MKSGISFIARQQNINHSFYLWAMLSPRAARSEDSGLKKPVEKFAKEPVMTHESKVVIPA